MTKKTQQKRDNLIAPFLLLLFHFKNYGQHIFEKLRRIEKNYFHNKTSGDYVLFGK